MRDSPPTPPSAPPGPSSAPTPASAAYVWFDLGSAKPIGTIQWQFLATGWADSLRVQVSHDRRSWTTRARVGNAPVGVWQSLATPGTTARYVRFYFANPNKDPRLGVLAEVKVLAQASGVPCLALE